MSGRQTEDLAWEPFIDGDQLLVSSLAGLPPEPHEAALSKDLVLEAIAYLRKVQPESMRPHWGILADCEAMTGMPGECAAIWEKHGIEILMPASHAGGHSPAEILSLPDYQFPIASLWKEAERTDKVIETLESVRRRDPSLQGVSRMLVDCYERMGDLETLPCAPRTRRSVTRPFARTASFGCSCASEARPKKRSAILRKRRKNTRVGPTVVGRGRQSVTSPVYLETLRSVVTRHPERMDQWAALVLWAAFRSAQR